MANRIFIDQYTGEKHDWVSIPAPKTEAQERRLLALPDDEVLHRVVRGVHYERVVTTPYYLGKWWGMQEHEDIYQQTQQAYNSIPEGKTLYLPGGEYRCSDTLQFNRRVSVFGDLNTTIYAPKGKDAVHIGFKARGATFEKFTIYGQGDTPNCNGLYVQGVVRLSEIVCRNLTGHGFFLFGDVEGQVTDVSHAKVRDCEAKENGGDGFRIQGPDANRVKLDCCDARDNKGIGFHDASFLGISFDTCMAHYNQGGDFVTDGASARTVNVGGYTEEGMQPSRQNRYSVALGGLLGSGMVGGLTFDGEHMTGTMRIGGIVVRPNQIDYNGVDFGPRFDGTWGYGLGKSEYSILQVLQHGRKLITGPEDNVNPSVNNQPRQRATAHPAISIPILFVSGRMLWGYSGDFNRALQMQPWADMEYNPGDTLNNMDYSGTGAIEMRCIAKGKGNQAQFKAIY